MENLHSIFFFSNHLSMPEKRNCSQINSSPIRQKGEPQNGCYKKIKHVKNEYSILPDTRTHVCVSGGKKSFFFRKIWRALFSCNTRFEVRPFTLLLATLPFCLPSLLLSINKITLKQKLYTCILVNLSSFQWSSFHYNTVLLKEMMF